MSFPIEASEPDLSAWTSVTVSQPGTPASAESRGTTVEGVFVGIKQIPATGETWGKVEANPSRVLDPDGHSLCSVAQLPEAVRRMVESGKCVLQPKVSVADFRVARIDVTRDFEGVERPSALLTGLQTVHRPYSRKNAVFNDGSRNGAQTLLVGGKSSSVRLYDKHAETKGVVAAGTLRFEAQCRRGWAQNYGGIFVVDDINTETVSGLGLDRWDWSGMGHEVTGNEEVVERVMRSGLSGADQRGLLGWLLMTSLGRESPMSGHTAAKYRAIARSLGIVLSPETFGSGTFTAQLDWQTGREVLRAA